MNQADVGVNKKTKRNEKGSLSSIPSISVGSVDSVFRVLRLFYFVKKIHIKSRARAHRFHEKVHFFLSFIFFSLLDSNNDPRR